MRAGQGNRELYVYRGKWLNVEAVYVEVRNAHSTRLLAVGLHTRATDKLFKGRNLKHSSDKYLHWATDLTGNSSNSMDLAVILPLALLLFAQTLISLLLLAPRAVSKHVAQLVSLTRTSTVVSTVLYTTAAAVGAMTVSSIIQLLGVNKSLSAPQFGDR